MMFGRRGVTNGEAALEQLLEQADKAVSEVDREWETGHPSNPEILDLCIEATQLATQLRQQLKEAQSPEEVRRIQGEGFRWIRDKTRAWSGRLASLGIPDLDRLNGCITRVSSAIAHDPRRLRTLRGAISRRGRRLGGRFP